MSDTILYFGGSPSPDLPGLIADQRHPRVEYLHFMKSYGARMKAFEEKQRQSALSPYWSLAWNALSDQGVALATGEDIGLPLALVQRLLSKRRPLYIITHGSYFGSRKAAAVFRLLRGASWVRFLCLSESLRRRLIDQYGIAESQAINVGYGVDTVFFSSSIEPPDGNVVVAAGMAHRDYRTLVKAVGDTGFDLRVAADSAWFRCGLDIETQSLPSNVDVRSYGDYVRLRALYARAFCVVVPLYEAVHACGYAVIAEAMAMGRPVIATRTASSSDYIIEGETGFLVPPGDDDMLRARLELLAADSEFAAWMGANARRRMEQHYSLEAYVGRIAVAMGLGSIQGERYENGAVFAEK